MAVARLVSSGHSLTDIAGYTIAQCRIFLKAHSELESQQRRFELMAIRTVWADNEAFETIWQQIGGGDGGK